MRVCVTTCSSAAYRAPPTDGRKTRARGGLSQSQQWPRRDGCDTRQPRRAPGQWLRPQPSLPMDTLRVIFSASLFANIYKAPYIFKKNISNIFSRKEHCVSSPLILLNNK